jgi:hypothetical protein
MLKRRRRPKRNLMRQKTTSVPARDPSKLNLSVIIRLGKFYYSYLLKNQVEKEYKQAVENVKNLSRLKQTLGTAVSIVLLCFIDIWQTTTGSLSLLRKTGLQLSHEPITSGEIYPKLPTREFRMCRNTRQVCSTNVLSRLTIDHRELLKP